MRKGVMVAALALLTPALLSAQTPKWSLGASALGIMYETESEVLSVSLPGGGGSLGLTNVFVGFFPTENIAVRPGVNFNLVSDGGTAWLLGIDANVEYHFSGVTMNSFYLFGAGTFAAAGNGESDSEFAAGGGAGYRYLAYDYLAFMFEASYRRWFDSELNQIMGVVKMEIVFN